MTSIDRLLACADNALRTVSGTYTAARRYPGADWPNNAHDAGLDAEQRRLAGALMRVNHVGEVCAQALYNAQNLANHDVELRQQFDKAAREENDHLAWTRQRLRDLGDRPSALNPLWYAGSFAIGLLAGRLGRQTSLGFVVETERQVEQHLQGHLHRLPAADHASRAVVEQMKADEAQHAETARSAGAAELPLPVKLAMRAAAAVMTRTAHYI